MTTATATIVDRNIPRVVGRTLDVRIDVT
jgi:hypothetical protein